MVLEQNNRYLNEDDFTDEFKYQIFLVSINEASPQRTNYIKLDLVM